MAAVAVEGVKEITTTLGEATIEEEEVATRHRKERKELQAKIQAIKKNAPKNDKKKRKEAMEEVTRLENEMEKRQALELKVATAHHQQQQIKDDNSNNKTSSETNTTNPNDVVTSNTISAPSNEQQRVSRAQKRRDKKAKEARQREDDIRAAAAGGISDDGPKATEARNLNAKLKERQLALYFTNADGDCLYNAIRHQLQHSGLVSYTVKELRTETSNYIRANKDSLIPYMTNPRTGELLNDQEFEDYCNAVCNTSAWGSQIELKALSSILKVPIEVLQAEGPPTIQGADEFSSPNLIITYHRYLYSLGEHYNSTLPLSEVAANSSGEEQEQQS